MLDCIFGYPSFGVVTPSRRRGGNGVAVVMQSVFAGSFSGSALPVTVTATGASDGNSVHWILVPFGDTTPSAAEVRNGQASSGGSPADSGSGTWPGSFSVALVSGIARADYKICVVIDNGTLSDAGMSGPVEIDTVAPVLSSGAGAENVGDIDWSVISDEASGTIHAALRLAANGVLSAASIINGTGNAIATNMAATPVANANHTGTFTAPAPETYVVDMVQQDSYGNRSAVISSGDVIIAPPGPLVEDDFETYADGTPLSGTANWDQGFGNTPKVVGGDAVATSSTVNGAFWSPAVGFGADFYAELQDCDPAGSFVGPYLFYQNARNYYRVVYKSDGSLQFRAKVAGTWEDVTNNAAPIMPSGSDTIRLAWDGGEMVACHNGAEQIRLTPTTPPTTGKIGFVVRDDGDRVGKFIGDDL